MSGNNQNNRKTVRVFKGIHFIREECIEIDELAKECLNRLTVNPLQEALAGARIQTNYEIDPIDLLNEEYSLSEKYPEKSEYYITETKDRWTGFPIEITLNRYKFKDQDGNEYVLWYRFERDDVGIPPGDSTWFMRVHIGLKKIE